MSAGTSITGLGSGLDTASIVSQLMSIESLPLTQIENSQSLVAAQQSAWSTISSKLGLLSSASDILASSARLSPTKTTSSDPSTVSVTGAGAAGSALTFRVLSLASAGQQAATGYGSASDVVGAGTLTLATGLSALGATHAAAASSLAAGAHTLTVSQASDAAHLSGSAPSVPVTIDSTNDTLAVSVNGTATTVTLAHTTYNDAKSLAAAVNTALAGTGAVADVSGGAVRLSTTNEGSAATLAVTGGTALGALGLATGSATGKDAVVALDGTAVTVTDVHAGATTTVGGLTLTLGSHLAAGSSAVTVARTSAGATLSDLSNTVNGSGSGAATTILNSGDPSIGTELVFTSKAVGTAGDVAVDMSGFAGGAGLSTLHAATDAQLSMGSQTITRSSNSITDLMPGATVTLVKANPSEDVSLTSAADTDGTVASVKGFVDALNAVVDAMATATKADPSGKSPGPLNGDPTLRSFAMALSKTLVEGSGVAGGFGALSQIGVRVDRYGHYSVDEGTLRTALAQNPDKVSGLLSRTATATDSRVAFSSATAATTAGTFGVQITAAATQASVTGSAFTTLAAAESLSVKVGATTATYAAPAGADVNTVAAGLNQAFTTAGVGVRATVAGGALTLTSTGYGTGAAFSVTSSTGGVGGTGLGGTSAAGTNVAGTINGVAATGTGRTLTSSTGLALSVSASGADVAAAGGTLSLGTVTFTTGIAGALSTLLTNARSGTGVVQNSTDALTAQAKTLADTVTRMQAELDAKQSMYEAQFSAMETAMAQIKASTPNFAAMLPSFNNGSNNNG